jgi:hypothetical protein
VAAAGGVAVPGAENCYAFQQLIRIVCFPVHVFSALIFVAFSAAIPVAPASSITTGAAIATCFAPEDNCNAFAVDAVNGAECKILVSAYHCVGYSEPLECDAALGSLLFVVGLFIVWATPYRVQNSIQRPRRHRRDLKSALPPKRRKRSVRNACR